MEKGWVSNLTILRDLHTTEGRKRISEIRQLLGDEMIEEKWVDTPHSRKQHKMYRLKPQKEQRRLW